MCADALGSGGLGSGGLGSGGLHTPGGVAVVTCIESGSLEDQVVRMIGSLRKWGGRFSSVEVYAVKARTGAPLSRATRLAMDRLQVQFLRADSKSYTPYHWLGLMSKPVAILEAEQACKQDILVWLDGDTLVVNEPADLLLGPETDFAAVAVEKSVGSCGPTDPFEPYWQAMASTTEVNLDQIGWVKTERGARQIRTYFNSGVMAIRRGCGFAAEYLQTANQIMNGRFLAANTGYYLHEQASLGFALAKLKLRWRAISQLYNYRCGMRGLDMTTAEELKVAKILHYHRAMGPGDWEGFLNFLSVHHPDVSHWLAAEYGPVAKTTPVFYKAINRRLRTIRMRKASAYRNSCVSLPISANEGEG